MWKVHCSNGYFEFGNELERVFGRTVDLLARERVEVDENPIFRRSVLNDARAVYAA